MADIKKKQSRRRRRKLGIRKLVSGSSERPRLTVFRSNKNIYAQIVDDLRGVTLCAASTRGKDIRDQVKNGGGKEAAKVVGTLLAQKAAAANVKAVCLDRNGYRYHGRLKALADAAREAGLSF